jgi:hypothetical protein
MRLLSCVVGTALTLAMAVAPAAEPDSIFGQQVVNQEMAKHPELALLSLHTVPPGGSQSAIIASSVLAKVGKKSDPDDLVVVQTGKPEVKDMPKRQIFDLLFPLLDKTGTVIGTIVMEVKFSAEKTSEGALQKGTTVQTEIRKLVASKDQLFERSPVGPGA